MLIRPAHPLFCLFVRGRFHPPHLPLSSVIIDVSVNESRKLCESGKRTAADAVGHPSFTAGAIDTMPKGGRSRGEKMTFC